MTQKAQITGKVEYREGDGANIVIRLGPCEVQVTALDATISWTDGDTHGSAAMPIGEYRSYLASQVLQLDAA
jgi:hypothetical protein